MMVVVVAPAIVVITVMRVIVLALTVIKAMVRR